MREPKSKSDTFISRVKKWFFDALRTHSIYSLKKTLLVTDDDKVVGDTVEACLRVEGYDIFRAGTGDEAVYIARSQRPDLIILDLMMPKMNGWDTCKVLKGDARTRAIPLIIMSGLSLMGDSEKAFEAGAADFLNKPFDREELIQKVRKWLS